MVEIERMVHPYYPLEVQLPGYHGLVVPFEQILAVFFSACAVVLLAGWFFTGKVKHLTFGERGLVCWFLCSGLIHLIIEGAVVLNDNFYQDKSGNILYEIWKEYAKADSRYATRDDFVISMEAVTAFVEGPGCFAIIYGMLKQKPWRYTAIILVSLGQLYGDVLYFGTCIHGGITRHSRPEWMYFWFYFVIVNGIWIVVPAICITYAAKRISAAVSGIETKQQGKKTV